LIAQRKGRQLVAESVTLKKDSMSAAHPAYLEFIDFIAGGTTPQQIIAFRPSEAAQQRVEGLLAKLKEDGLSPDEQSELDSFCELEHIFRVAKARAAQILALGA
jgi:hypothetical protein